MFRKLFDRHKLEITIISCGDTGQELGIEMIKTLTRHGANVSSLAITSELEAHHESKIFTKKVSIDDKSDGFAKRFDEGYEAAKAHRNQIEEAIDDIIPKEEGGLMLVTTGAGATGLGSAMVVVDILFKTYRNTPPILTLLPEAFENSRVQYNMSLFLYRVSFSDTSYGNSIILLDNKPSLDEMDEPMAKVARTRIETIPIALADLLYASFTESLSPEFDANTEDLFDVIHTPGVSVIVAENLGESGQSTADSSRIEDVISDNVIATTALTKEGVFGAKNAFISLFNISNSEQKLSLQTEFEARKLFREFRDTHPFVKMVASANGSKEETPKLRAIIAGLPLPTRILQIMRLARESRKRIIVKEKMLENEVIPLDIVKVETLEEELKEF